MSSARRRTGGHHKKRRRPKVVQTKTLTGYVGTCDTCKGKRLFINRKAARRALRDLKRSPRFDASRESPMREYPCPTGNGWHFGHHPRAVLEGRLSYQDFASRQGHVAKAREIDEADQ